jgi:hypothetical protein
MAVEVGAMTLPDKEPDQPKEVKGWPSLRRGTFKTVFYIVVLGFSLSVLNLLFGWGSVEEVPPVLQPFSSVILLVNPYLVYIQAALLLLLGYLVVNAASGMVYSHVRRMTDHSTAATVQTITKIAGIAILLSMMTSVFNVNPAAALTVGSFGGLVMGFATQTILSHVVAGVFLLLSRPFTHGDTVTISGQTGVVKDVRLMHLVLETEDGTKEILIPSGTVVTQIIQKKIPAMRLAPVNTALVLEAPPRVALAGSTIKFTGRLVEVETGKPVTNAAVQILDSDVDRDDLLASGVTGSDGIFRVEWSARKTDRWDNTAEIYAKFAGSDSHRPSKSRQYVVEIEGA